MFLFLDIETTGLDDKLDFMLEIALLEVSDGFEVLGACTNTIDPVKGGRLNNKAWRERMNAYVTEMHTKSGLLDLIEGEGVEISVAEENMLAFIDKSHVIPDDKIVIAGNSIHFDRRFIREQMPCLEKRFHYRMVDVSSIRLMVTQNWPGLVPERVTESKHRAFDDAAESLAEYHHYVNQLNPRRWRKNVYGG